MMRSFERPVTNSSPASKKPRSPVHSQPPPYPTSARRAKQEGLVLLRLKVDKDGRVQNVEIQETSGHTVLDQSAAAAVQTWRFEPARRGAQPVDATVEVPIRFKLH